MQQLITNFKIKIFNVRNPSEATLFSDASFISSISIRRDIQLNNSATISIFKDKAYEAAEIEKRNILSLYNYVSISYDLVEIEGSSRKTTPGYFSGFITEVNTSDEFGTNPTSAVFVTISDFGLLLKTTFYTKNLTFLDVLASAIPDLRLLNFNEVFAAATTGSKDKTGDAILSQAYTLSQMAFLLFAFFVEKFFKTFNDYAIISPDSGLKRFTILPAFGIENKSLWQTQSATLQIYKSFQTNAYDLFKYLFTEPFFEFSIFETANEITLLIRPAPLASCDNDSNYTVIDFEKFDMGIFSPSWQYSDENQYTDKLKSNIDPLAKYLQAITNDKLISSNRYLATPQAIKQISNTLYNRDMTSSNKPNEILLDGGRILSMSTNKTQANVVNLIYTTSSTDTALLNISSKVVTYAYFDKRLKEISTNSTVALEKYIGNQFSLNGGTFSNPIVMRSNNTTDYMPGDIRYFGIREFEARWNSLNLCSYMVSTIFGSMTADSIAKLQGLSGDSFYRTLYLLSVADASEKKIAQIENSKKTIESNFEAEKKFYSSAIEERSGAGRAASENERVKSIKDSFASLKKKTEEEIERLDSNLAEAIAARTSANDKLANSSASLTPNQELGKSMLQKHLEIYDANATSEGKISKLVGSFASINRLLKEEYNSWLCKFTGFLNTVLGYAYKSNENLFGASIRLPLTMLYPGQIITTYDQDTPTKYGINIKGYCASVVHNIDFRAASMTTNIELTRAHRRYA